MAATISPQPIQNYFIGFSFHEESAGKRTLKNLYGHRKRAFALINKKNAMLEYMIPDTWKRSGYGAVEFVLNETKLTQNSLLLICQAVIALRMAARSV
jgi:hypothetical protein